MAFVPSSPAAALVEGEVDYRLARSAVLAQYRAGEVAASDVCDIHPELLRAAREYSVATVDDCPVCDEEKLALVSYVFGPRLGPGGRCVQTPADLDRIRRRRGTFKCYRVEVCTGCGWNHLRRAFTLAGRASAPLET